MLFVLKFLAILLVIVGAARPQKLLRDSEVSIEGIDIVLALDTSGSMRALDFEMNGRRYDRLTVVKKVVDDFIKKRPNDRIAMLAFASAAYTICPLTLDHDWLSLNLDRVGMGMIEDGTAIGSAIASALNRLQGSKIKSKIIILLTDGRNNAGITSPLTAAEAAKALGVKIYTIGAGALGQAPFPVKDQFGNTAIEMIDIEIDEDLLKNIAQVTGGKYYRATDMVTLQNIYKEIDSLEKTKIEEIKYLSVEELYKYFLYPALLIFLFVILLSETVFRRIP
ncbi:MAG: VWA domain-containing protein, partial [Candidatus Omnitrophica bacterium]|nr:VWA domain-containing protein [Candidatus Omnitrophota bacterium]